MKFLTCIFCDGELELLNPFDSSSTKKVKCKKCNNSSKNEKTINQPEVVFIKKSKI